MKRGSGKMQKKVTATLVLFLALGCILIAGPNDINSSKPAPLTQVTVMAAEQNPSAPPQSEWESIKASYNYDHSAPLNIEIKDTKDFPAYTKIHFFFDSLNGGRVPAVLMMPKPHVRPMKTDKSTVPGAYPVVFFMHFHVSDKSLADIFATWPGYGIAVMAIDGVFRGERKEEGKDILMPDPETSALYIGMQIRDILRGIDVLAQWKGLDPGRIGYMGVSMGAMTGTCATALDERVKTVILADGGADYSLIFDNSLYGSLKEIKQYMTEHNMTKDQFVDIFKFVDPVVFAPHLNGKTVLAINGRQDDTISLPAMLKLHEVIGTDKKKIIWYDSGHVLPVDKLVGDSLKWFKGTL
jgi:cephalosporin-C deacetylase-like acetyl esterase